MVEILGTLIDEYIEPILKFADVYIGKDGYLRPIGGSDPNFIYRYENKDVIVVRSDVEFNAIREQKDVYEIFNPFIINKHMTFVMYLVLAKINQIADYTYFPRKNDEDDDEELVITTRIEVFENKTDTGLTELSLCYVDENKNPVKTITSYAHIYPVLCLYGLCLNAMKNFKKVIPPLLRDTDNATDMIVLGLAKYEKAKKAKSKELTGFKAIDMTDEDDDYIIFDYADNDYDLDLDSMGFKRYITPFMSSKELGNMYSFMRPEDYNFVERITDENITDALNNTFSGFADKYDDVDIDI